MGIFGSNPARTGTSAPLETPYIKAAQEWDNRIGTARAMARNWRLAALGALAVAAIAVVGLILEAQKSQVKAFYVPIDEIGRPGRIEAADEVYRPKDAQIAYFLGEWVRMTFSKSIDPIVLKANLNRSFSFLYGRAAQTMKEWGQENDPTQEIGKTAKTIEIASVLKRTDTTYQVQWREILYVDGQRTSINRYTGLFTIIVQPPRNEAQLLANPLGIFINDISWSPDQ